MSRWTKGELTIGEIAQMERELIDIKALQNKPIRDEFHAALIQNAILFKIVAILETMLKG